MTISDFSFCTGGSAFTLRNVSLENCAVVGISISDSALIEDTTVRSPMTGIAIQPSMDSSVVLRRTQILSTAPESQESWMGLRIHFNLPTTATGNITLEDSVIEDPFANRHNSTGIQVLPPYGAPYSLRVRRTRIQTSRAVMLAGGDLQSVDFGTAASPGQNALVSNLRCIEDLRDARSAADGLVASFVGTTLNGMSLAPGTILTGPAFSYPYYYLHNANTRVGF